METSDITIDPPPPSLFVEALKCIGAGLPGLGFAVVYLTVLLDSPLHPEFTPDVLVRLMKIEFIVIHSFAFVGLIGLARPGYGSLRLLRAIAFWGLLVTYAICAAATGWEGLVTFVCLGVVRYVGFLMRIRDPGATWQILMRWLVSLLAFMLLAIAFGMPMYVPDWSGSDALLAFGMTYFGLLAMLELIGVYRWRIVRSALARASRVMR